MRQARVTWGPAIDNATPTSDIVYRVYVSDTRYPSYSDPIAESQPGALEVSVDLSPYTEYSFAVRAVDLVGNVDDNVVTVTARTRASFSENVQPIFSGECALAGCHVPGNPVYGLDRPD